MTISLLILLLLVSLPVACNHSYNTKSVPSEVDTNLCTPNVIPFREVGDSAIGLMASIAHVGEQHYLIADYKKIVLFDAEDNTLHGMNTDLPCDKYVPNGLYYSSKNEKLYVANYLENNILVFYVDIEHKKLSLIQEIRSENTISPKNVYVNDEGKILVSANEDGNSVTAFDITAEIPRQLWSTSLGQAHGICILGNKVYATSLSERVLAELDLQSGKILKKLGRLGWDPLQAGFLWPTSVYPYTKGELVLTDAHTGLIYIINADQMKITRYFGGNGPTFRFLNMPYNTITDDNDNIVILSTFQQRLIMGEKNSLKFKRSIFLRGHNNWSYLSTTDNSEENTILSKKIKRLGNPDWEGYIFRNGPRLEILGSTYMLGYALLYPLNIEMPYLMLPGKLTLFNPEYYFYFLDSLVVNDNYLLFSPQNATGLCIIKDTGAAGITYMFPVDLSFDTWRIGGEIYDANSKKDVNSIFNLINNRVVDMEKARFGNGLIKEDNLYNIAFNTLSCERYRLLFENTFVSKPGKEFLRKYKKFMERTNSVERYEVITATKEYFGDIRGEKRVDMGEYILIQMLTGISVVP